MTLTPTQSRSLTAFRVASYVVGVLLVVFVFVAIPLKYLADNTVLYPWIPDLHGAMFIVYTLLTVRLGLSRGWSLLRMGVVALAGVVPFMSFWIERQITAQVRDGVAGV